MHDWRTWLLAACLTLTFACREGLYHDLDEQSANQIVAALQVSGIDAAKITARSGYDVEVPRGTSAEAMAALERSGLPRDDDAGFAAVYADTIVPSPMQEHARLQHATAYEIGESLRAIDGVVDAKVNLVLAAPALGKPQAKRTPKASVVVKWNGSEPPLGADDVRRIVAAGVADLAPAAIEVLVTEARSAPETAAKRLVAIGPITVPAANKATTQLVLALLVSCSLALGVVLLARGRRT